MVSAVMAFISIYGIKLLMNKIPILMHVQFLNQFSVLWLVISLFLIGLRIEESLKIREGKVDCAVAKYIADYTFEIYLVQYIAIHIVEDRLSFPLNSIAAVIMIAVFAYVLKRIEKLIYKAFKTLFKQ